MKTKFNLSAMITTLVAKLVLLLLVITQLSLMLVQAQSLIDGPESMSYDPNNPSNIVSQWEGPATDKPGWTYWRATMGDNSQMWVWDNGQGERRFGYDTNNDGLYEKWQEELSVPGLPLYQVYHWDRNQDGTDNAIAWAEGGAWIEKVWDSNSDGLIDSWCSYSQAGCSQYLMYSDCNLVDKKNTFDTAYRNYLTGQSRSAIEQKRLYSIYQRADLIFRICKNLNRQ